MDKRLQAVIDNAIAALRELECEMRVTSIYPSILGTELHLFIRDVKDLERIPGPATIEPWTGESADWRLSKDYNGVTIVAVATNDELSQIKGDLVYA